MCFTLYILTCNMLFMASNAPIPISQQPPIIKGWMDAIESSFENDTELKSYEDIAATVPARGILSQMQWFGGAATPSVKVPGQTVAQFVKQYRDYGKITAGHVVPALDDFYALKFPNAILALFNAATQFGELYSGYDLLSGQFTDMPLVPQLVNVSTKSTTSQGVIDGSFAQPASVFKNTLTGSSTSATDIQGAWLKNYFTINNSQSAGGLYPGAPATLDNVITVLFGVFDPIGNIDGVYFTDSTNKSSKPIRQVLGQFSALTNESSTQAHVLHTVDPLSAFYVGKDKTGYMSVHTNAVFDIAAHSTTMTASTKIEAVPLGVTFAKAEFVTSLNKP